MYINIRVTKKEIIKPLKLTPSNIKRLVLLVCGLLQLSNITKLSPKNLIKLFKNLIF